ncbi:hypothetical protein CR205_02785 [Alteribacter lacisalsi]|uniref:GTP-binding protein n=1 Tax=Alteribacter lacisalsi TaxID=2045244 RepID=A0A2W0HL02_9BACI|nr:GTP-binding protein [Alteribacter lacisalsi]PYZ97539.1 hypothetical protein CR205_02785 [Alteribacter lacisalsi]
MGSGKTTLLHDIIKSAGTRGVQLNVLMNEVGRTDTDSSVLKRADKNLAIESLLDGCMCCNKKSEVAGAICKLASQRPDAIVVELTGVADPEEVADTLSEPELLSRVELKRVISVLDGENLLDYSSIFTADREMVRTTTKQITFADSLIVNKMDLVTQKKLDKIKKLIEKESPGASAVFTEYCRVDLEETVFNSLNDGSGRMERERDNYEEKLGHSRIKTIRLDIDGPLQSKRAVENFFKTFRPGLLRAKGYVPVKSEHKMYLMQHVIRKTSWERVEVTSSPFLILIGLELDEKRIQEEWAKLHAVS